VNVLDFVHAGGAARQALIARRLAELAPDIAALQEMRAGDVRELLGAGVEVVAHPGAVDGVGACLASRWPIVRVGTCDLRLESVPDGLPWAAAVAAEIDAPPPFGRLLVVHHKPTWQLDREAAREQQALATARFVEELTAGRAGLPVVLLGDFDAPPDAASIRFLTGRQSLDGVSVRYEDAWAAAGEGAGETFTPENPLVRRGDMPLERGRRIDYVMVRAGAHGPLLDVAACRRVLDRPEGDVWPSDHFGVLADLVPPPHQPGSWA
jgi:endonuclease/exonuclease/phosphatase family metal-dependent hydrolase